MTNRSHSNVDAPTRIDLCVLGPFHLLKDGKRVSLPTRKTESLLAYLALYPEPHAREKLAALFWGDSPDKQARLSLRVCLNHLRKLLSKDLLLSDSETVRINPGFPLSVDALQFQDRAAHFLAELSPVPDLVNLDLYRGELLSDYYDEWIRPDREQLGNFYLNVLLKLVQHARAASEYNRAIELAHKILASDAANERAYQHLMFCYVRIGNRTAALQQYQDCKNALWEELGVEPAAETINLHLWILGDGTTPKSFAPRLTNLPIPLTSFIGREREIAEVKGKLIPSDVSSPLQKGSGGIRLLTLTGAGGSGKTRLAIQAATDLVERFRDGVWWVELAGLRDPTLVPEAVAKTFGIAQIPAQSLIETLANFLGSKHLLLILDNCEHLVLACAQLVESLLRACPNLIILTTTRELLGITGEIVWQVPTLSVPDPSISHPHQLMEYESVRLFVERARAVKSDFALTEQNGRAVAHICRSLDGIPLAIELAAARTRLLTLEHIAGRLADRFNLLTTGGRTALPRHQTLRATIDWSYDLLPEEARRLLRRLSVFAGGFTLEAAESVCADEQLPSRSVLNVLARLMDGSLVIGVQMETDERYRMLETIREYGRDQLAEAGELEVFRWRHLEYFVQLAERAESDWYGSRRLEWFKRVESEHDNLNAALDSSLALPSALEQGLRLAAVLGHFWAWRTHKAEGRYWLDKLVAASRDHTSGSTLPRARVLWAAGFLAFEAIDDLLARQLLEESVALCRKLKDERGLGLGLLWLGLAVGLHSHSGRALVDESVEVLRNGGDKWALAYALGHRGARYNFRPQHAMAPPDPSALQDLHESLALFEELGDQWTIEVPLGGLCEFKIIDGEYAQARTLYERCIRIDRELENEYGAAAQLTNLAELSRAEGDYAEAQGLYTQALEIWRNSGNKQRVTFISRELAAMVAQSKNLSFAVTLLKEHLRSDLGGNPSSPAVELSLCQPVVGAAAVCAASNQPLPAARLLAAVEASYRGMTATLWWQNRRTEYERTLAAVRGKLDQSAFTAALTEGRTMTLRQATEYALASLEELQVSLS